MKLSITKKTVLIVAMLSAVTTTYAAMGFLIRGEVSGTNKICYYDVLESTRTINVPSYSVCPVSHNF